MRTGRQLPSRHIDRNGKRPPAVTPQTCRLLWITDLANCWDDRPLRKVYARASPMLTLDS
jgi:hypothetical protein